MVKLSLPMKFTIFLSVSLTASTTSSYSTVFLFKSSAAPKATPSDLLALLGPTSQSSTVNPLIAQQLNSCFKFLVQFTPTHSQDLSIRRSLKDRNFNTQRHQDELIWWPPEPVLELAQLAVDSGGDPDVIYRTLDPTVLPVPDVEGCKEYKCELTRTPYGRRFISQELNSYLKYLFELVVARGPSVGLRVSLNRYDLFHGHIFIATETGRLGILFHAREYPAYDKDVFPYNMGYCQIGVLVVLDARPDGIIYRDIIPEYVNFARTIYEDDLGEAVADVNYLNVGGKEPDYQIFIC